MILLILSFFAWILTILAPCILPLLPVILWVSIEDSENKAKPYIVIGSLMLSIIFFSILLKASTVFLSVNPIVWKIVSWFILITFWLITIFPKIWEKISWKIVNKSNQNLVDNSQRKWVLWSILVWASLWPVFTSCSPTYAVILAVILPVSFFIWFLNLIAYVFWLGIVLLLIALFGQKFVWKLKFVSSPNWIFKKVLWVIFILIWFSIIMWYDKIIETKILDSWFFDATKIEQNILDKIDIKQ